MAQPVFGGRITERHFPQILILLCHPFGRATCIVSVPIASVLPRRAAMARWCASGTWRVVLCHRPQWKNATVGDGSRYLLVSNETITVFDTASGKELSRILTSGMEVKSARELNHNLASMCWAIQIPQWQVWRAATGEKIGSAINTPNGSKAALLSDDGRTLAVCRSNSVQMWNVAKGTTFSIPLTNPGSFISAALQPNGALLAVAYGSSLHVWNTTNGQRAFPPFVHPRLLSDVAFSPDGKYFATACHDGQVAPWYAQVWSASTGKPVGKKMWHNDGVAFYVSFLAPTASQSWLLEVRTTVLLSGT